MPFDMSPDDLMWPTLQVLTGLGGSGTIEEIQSQLVSALTLTDEQINQQQENAQQTDFYRQSALARTFLKKTGLATNPRWGVWVLTPEGQSATEAIAKQKIYEYRHALYENKKKEAVSPNGKDEDGKAVERAIESVIESEVGSEIEWTEALLKRIRNLSPGAFERLCQRLLRESGFQYVKVTGKVGDGGIDGVGILRVNLVSFQVVFQCKRFKDVVGASYIRDFRGAMDGRGEKGLLITTGRFTEDAQLEARRDGATAIDLIDGVELCQILKDLRLGVSVRQVEEIEVAESFFDQFEVQDVAAQAQNPPIQVPATNGTSTPAVQSSNAEA